MNSVKFGLLSLVAAALMFVPQRATAFETNALPALNANLQLARQLNEAFVQVAEEVSPSVVVITVTQKASAIVQSDDGQDENEDPMEHMWRFFHQRQRQEQQSPEKSIGQGSGIIIRKDGYILTNRHVVEEAEKIEVRLKDGRTFRAEVRGVDAPADVAVIKIDARNLTVARLADSDKTRVGEFAIAIGAPFALEYSVTFGHVSAKNRTDILSPENESQTAMLDQSFIQTDANINPGNSGGPLINIDGEVIGINTLIRGMHTGIGFAIPINLAREVADKLISDGKFTRSWLGISIVSLRDFPRMRDWVGKDLQEGVVINEIVPNGPAAKSKLRPADVITAVDGKPVRTSQELKDEIRAKKVGHDVALDIFRPSSREGAKTIKIIVQPGEWVDTTVTASNLEIAPAEGGGNRNPLGLTVKNLTPELARKFNVDAAEGVIVTSIDKNGLAAQNGIQEGDIITSIDDHPIGNLKQFREAMKTVDIKKKVIIHFISDGVAKFEILKEEGD